MSVITKETEIYVTNNLLTITKLKYQVQCKVSDEVFWPVKLGYGVLHAVQLRVLQHLIHFGVEKVQFQGVSGE